VSPLAICCVSAGDEAWLPHWADRGLLCFWQERLPQLPAVHASTGHVGTPCTGCFSPQGQLGPASNMSLSVHDKSVLLHGFVVELERLVGCVVFMQLLLELQQHHF